MRQFCYFAKKLPRPRLACWLTVSALFVTFVLIKNYTEGKKSNDIDPHNETRT